MVPNRMVRSGVTHVSPFQRFLRLIGTTLPTPPSEPSGNRRTDQSGRRTATNHPRQNLDREPGRLGTRSRGGRVPAAVPSLVELQQVNAVRSHDPASSRCSARDRELGRLLVKVARGERTAFRVVRRHPPPGLRVRAPPGARHGPGRRGHPGDLPEGLADGRQLRPHARGCPAVDLPDRAPLQHRPDPQVRGPQAARPRALPVHRAGRARRDGRGRRGAPGHAAAPRRSTSSPSCSRRPSGWPTSTGRHTSRRHGACASRRTRPRAASATAWSGCGPSSPTSRTSSRPRRPTADQGPLVSDVRGVSGTRGRW